MLLSILIGGGQTNDGASLMSAMRAGDGINHAIFTKEELASGFYRLTVEKYIIARNGKYFAAEQSKSLYAQAQKIIEASIRPGIIWGRKWAPNDTQVFYPILRIFINIQALTESH